MLKTLVTGALIVTASSLPAIAQVRPGLGRSDSIASSPQSYAQVCTNDIDGRLSVRSGPGRSFPKLGEIPNGQIVGLISGQYRRINQRSIPTRWFLVVENYLRYTKCLGSC